MKKMWLARSVCRIIESIICSLKGHLAAIAEALSASNGGRTLKKQKNQDVGG